MEGHYLTIENKNKLTISHVTDVDAFDEKNLWANIQDGTIEIRGENLTIEKLDLERGELVVKGNIVGFSYGDKKINEKIKSFRILKRKS